MTAYARILDGVMTVINPPPDLTPLDPTADDKWWDLRQYDLDQTEWEEEIIGPHGWVPIVATPQPPNTATDTYDLTVELIDSVPTEVWIKRPWTAAELGTIESATHTNEMQAEQDESVDKLIAAVEALNLLTSKTNATINANPAQFIKDLARECKTIARVANREARMTSGRVESTHTGTETG